MKRTVLTGWVITLMVVLWHLSNGGPGVSMLLERAAAAQQGADLKKYLADLPETMTLNQNGEEYQTVKFNHAAHASEKYVPGVTCQTCHHTQKGDEKPEKCSKCHALGGEAKETKKKSKGAHNKDDVYPKQGEQKGVSCIGCHTAENALLEAGKRSGKEAPTKCTPCHEEKAS